MPEQLRATHTVVRVRNQTGGTLLKGKLLAPAGYEVATGLVLVDLADKDNPALRPAIGVAQEDVPDSAVFEMLVAGGLSGLDTSAFALTDQLVLGNNGDVIRPPPDQDPFTGEVQLIGSVIRVDATDGHIAFAVGSGLEPVTADQIFALAGSSGTPSKDNPFVTDADSRLAGALTHFHATAAGDIQTTSTTFILAAGMTLTPGAGDYLVWFSSAAQNSTDSADTIAAAFANGVEVVNSSRMIEPHTHGSFSMGRWGIGTIAKVAGLGAGQAIEIRWRVSAGTGTLGNRSLTLLKVG